MTLLLNGAGITRALKGAASIEEAPEAQISECSPAAAELGIAADQTVKQALALLF